MPDFTREAEHGGRVAGVDEVGMGPLAGPVVAAAVVFSRGVSASLADVLDDSKKLSAARREKICDQLPFEPGIEIAIGAASVTEIGQLNILRAAQLAMRRAVARLPAMPDLALVDGNRVPQLGCPCQVLVGGDGLSLSIAAASIVAKVTRDRIMARLDARWPGYGWVRNSGYPTKAHRDALALSGRTPHHRAAFGAVREQLALEAL